MVGRGWFYTRWGKPGPHEAGIFSEGSFFLGFEKKPDCRKFKREAENRILSQGGALFDFDYE